MITVSFEANQNDYWPRDEAIFKTEYGHMLITTHCYDYEDDGEGRMVFLYHTNVYDRELIDLYEECLDDWNKIQLQNKLEG